MIGHRKEISCRTRRKHRLTRRGISFVDLVVSLPATAMLIGCLGLCIGLMMKAKTQDENLFQSSYQLTETLSRISTDLELATSIASISSDQVEFTVPDRDGDGLPEQIKYQWANAASANPNTLLWSMNGGIQTVLFEDIGGFLLTPRSTVVSGLVPCHQLSEVAILKRLDSLPDCSYKESAISASKVYAQYFIPDLNTANALWDLGKLRLMVKSAGGTQDGILRVRVTGSSLSQTPSTTIYAEIDILESSLGPNYRWLTIPIAPISRQIASTPLCVTLSSAGGTGDIAYVQSFKSTSNMPANCSFLSSTNGGASWSNPDPSSGIRLYAYGFYDGYTGSRQFLTSLDLRLVSARNSTIIAETSIRMQTQPELPTTDVLTMAAEE